jgi:LuxR family maltose regulon positive regulatory protein
VRAFSQLVGGCWLSRQRVYQLPRLQKLLILREHLLELLDKGLEYKLTLIAGPAGYGKTTSVSQWIAERGTRANFPHVASVTLDEGDNDPLRFWHYIISKVRGRGPGGQNRVS